LVCKIANVASKTNKKMSRSLVVLLVCCCCLGLAVVFGAKQDALEEWLDLDRIQAAGSSLVKKTLAKSVTASCGYTNSSSLHEYACRIELPSSVAASVGFSFDVSVAFRVLPLEDKFEVVFRSNNRKKLLNYKSFKLSTIPSKLEDKCVFIVDSLGICNSVYDIVHSINADCFSFKFNTYISYFGTFSILPSPVQVGWGQC